MFKIYSYLVIIILLTTQLVFAQKKNHSKPAITDLPENVSIHQLDNGIQVLLIENPALPMVGVNVVIKTGSAYETFATSGMSHMLEHLLFNGTTSRTQKELYDQVDLIGGYNNANTGEYFTNFMMVTPAEFIKKGMELQADMLFNSSLPQEKFKKEKGIVLEEIAKSLADPEAQYSRNMENILYAGHALSLSTLGTFSTIEHMERDDVYKFYKNNYAPNNMIMSVVGRFERAQMLKDIKAIYGQAPPGRAAAEKNTRQAVGFEAIPLNDKPLPEIFHRTYGGEEKHLQLFFRLPASYEAQFYDLLDLIFTNQVNDLEKAAKDKFPQLIKSLQINVHQKPVVSYAEVDVTLQGGGSLTELSDFINAEMSAMKFRFSAEKISAEISGRRTGFLKNIEKPHMFGIYNAQSFAEGGIERVLSSYGRSGYEMAASELKKLKLYSAEKIIIQYPAKRAGDAQKQFEIVTRLYTDNVDGADLIIRQNPSSPLLAIHYLIKHKAPLESKYGKDAAKLLHECIGIRLDSEEMKKRSGKYGLTYAVNDNPFIPMDNIYLHPDFGYIRVEGLAENSGEAIKFLNETLLNFIPTAEEYKQALAKSKRSAPMMGMGNMTKKVFNRLLDENLYQANPYSMKKPIESIEQIQEFSARYFQPQNMIIAAVGPDSLEKIAELFSSFSSAGNDKNMFDVYEELFKANTQEVKIDNPGGGEQVYLYWGFLKAVSDEDKPALKALSLALSDRIVFDVREKQGMAYRMKAGIEVRGGLAAFYVNMGTRAQNVEQLIPQFPGFFKKGYIKNITKEELRKSINMYLGRMMFRRLSSINQAYYLSHSLYFHNDIEYDQAYLEKLKAVDLDQVKTVAEKYLKAEKTIQIIAR